MFRKTEYFWFFFPIFFYVSFFKAEHWYGCCCPNISVWLASGGASAPPAPLGCSPMAEFLVGKGFLGLSVGKPIIFDFFFRFFFHVSFFKVQHWYGRFCPNISVWLASGGASAPPAPLGCSPMAEFLVGKGFLGLSVGKLIIFDFFSDFFYVSFFKVQH